MAGKRVRWKMLQLVNLNMTRKVHTRALPCFSINHSSRADSTYRRHRLQASTLTALTQFPRESIDLQ